MARFSKETRKRLDGKANLIPQHVIVVQVASFTFRFGTIKQLRDCIKYYKQKRTQAVESQPVPLQKNSAKIGESSGDGK
jgi:hypothetical protein